MWSEEAISASAFEHYEIDITDDERQKLKENYEGEIVDGKLILSPSHQVQSALADEQKAKLKEDIKNAKSLAELKSALETLLT